MSYTLTPNLSLLKPTDQDDISQWGVHLNTDMDILDASVTDLKSTFITTVPSIAALRMLTTGVTVVLVQGYYVPRDGGGGYYTRGDPPAPDNGGSIINSANGTYYLQTFGGPITVKQFGAKGDGVTDDTTAIQATINAAASQRSGAFFPGYSASFYRVSGTINITGPISLYGNQNTSMIKTSSATADTVVVMGDNVLIDGLRFGATVTKTSGSYNAQNRVSSVTIRSCYFENHWFGVSLMNTTSAIVTIDDCYFFNCVSGGIGIRINGGDGFVVRNTVMNSAASPQPAAGISITASASTTLEALDIIQHSDCLLMSCGPGQQIDSVWVTDSFFDTSTGFGVAIDSATGYVLRCRFIGCWFSAHGQHGVLVEGARTSGIEFIDCHAFNNTQSGFALASGSDITLIGCQAAGNGVAGCALAAGMDGFTLIGNTFGATAGFTGNAYGISTADGTGDHFIISGNRLMGNTTKAISLPFAGSNIALSGNIGYVSKATDVVSFPAASTSVVVTHGLSATPPVHNILLTMNSGLGTAISVWVSATGPTTFTITSGAAPGGTLAIAWQASLDGA